MVAAQAEAASRLGQCWLGFRPVRSHSLFSICLQLEFISPTEKSLDDRATDNTSIPVGNPSAGTPVDTDARPPQGEV